jgi:hypothetical protein
MMYIVYMMYIAYRGMRRMNVASPVNREIELHNCVVADSAMVHLLEGVDRLERTALHVEPGIVQLQRAVATLRAEIGGGGRRHACRPGA